MEELKKRDNNDIYNKEWAVGPFRDKKWVFDYCDIIMDTFYPKSIVDVGCGVGDVLFPFEKRSLDVLGIDGSIAAQNNLKIQPGNFRLVDLRDPLLLDRKYDLAICMEVGEHVEKEFDDILIDNVCRLSDTIVWCADSGKVSRYHPNPNPKEYWIRKYEKRGFSVDSAITSDIKSKCIDVPGMSYDTYAINLVVFKKC